MGVINTSVDSGSLNNPSTTADGVRNQSIAKATNDAISNSSAQASLSGSALQITGISPLVAYSCHPETIPAPLEERYGGVCRYNMVLKLVKTVDDAPLQPPIPDFVSGEYKNNNRSRKAAVKEVYSQALDWFKVSIFFWKPRFRVYANGIMQSIFQTTGLKDTMEELVLEEAGQEERHPDTLFTVSYLQLHAFIFTDWGVEIGQGCRPVHGRMASDPFEHGQRSWSSLRVDSPFYLFESSTPRYDIDYGCSQGCRYIPWGT